MKRKAAASIAVLIAVTSCGAKSEGNDSNGGSAVENATLAKINLTTAAFRAGQAIPREYTCDGANRSPALSWGEPPQGTRSFALVIEDPDAPNGTFRHWGVFDIPATARSMGGGQRIGTEVRNDKGSIGYTGPCPPPGHGPHHYHFKLFALDVNALGIGADSTVADVENAASKHAIAEGELIGTYERK